MKIRITFLLFLYAVLLLPCSGLAQEAELSLHLEEEESAFFLGKLHRVKCEVVTKSTQKTKLIIKPELPLKLLSPASYKINSKAAEPYSPSIKIYFPNTTLDGQDSLRCEFILQSLEDESVLATGKLCLPIKERIVIRLEPQKEQLPIKSTDSLALIPLRINNLGNRRYDVELSLVHTPKGLKIPVSKMDLTLREKNDTLVNIIAMPDNGWQKEYAAHLRFELKIKDSGEQVADCDVTAFPLSYAKKYVSPKTIVNNMHEFSLGAFQRSGNTVDIEEQVRGYAPVKNGVLSYRFQSMVYTSTKEFELLNAMAKYYRNSNSINFGNINYQGEISLSGRGLHFENERDSQYFHAGYINGAYNLLEPGWATNTVTGNSLFGGFHKNFGVLGLIGADATVRLSDEANSGLIWLSNDYDDKNESRSIMAGLSTNQNIATEGQSSVQPGFALGFDYSKKMRDWDFQSSNLYASAAYAGSSSGSLQFNESVKYNGFEPVAVGASLRSIRSTALPSPGQRTMKTVALNNIQLQLETVKMSHWKFILSPYKSLQKRNYVDKNQPGIFYKSNTDGLRSVMSFRKDQNTVAITGDISSMKFGQQVLDGPKLLAYQAGFNFSSDDFNLNTAYSVGSTLLSDAISPEGQTVSPSNFLALLRWQKRFFERKVKTVLSHQLTHNSIRGQWFNASAVKLEFTPNKAFSLEAELFVLSTKNFMEKNINLKLSKKIGNYRPPSGARKLKIILYDDADNSSQHESAESPVSGIFVQVNGIPFVSNDDGWVQYKAIPMGEYVIDLVDPSGNLAAGRQVVQVDGNLTLEIPLYKTGVLNGMVTEIKQRFKNARFELTGIPVVAKNSQGDEFSTYTQPDGSFVLNLPQNEYTVYLDTRAFDSNFELPDNYQQISVKQSEASEVTLSVKVKSRKMTVQKF